MGPLQLDLDERGRIGAAPAERQPEEPGEGQQLASGGDVLSDGRGEREALGDEAVGGGQIPGHHGDDRADQALVGAHGIGLRAVGRRLVGSSAG